MRGPKPKKLGRRRRTDAAPTAHSCQLVTRPAHCRFERFQRVGERRDAAGRERPIASPSPRPLAAKRGEGNVGSAIDSNLTASLGRPDRTNIAQNMASAKNFQKPPAGVTGAAPTGSRRGVGPPRNIGRGDRATATLRQITGLFMSRNRKLSRRNSERIRAYQGDNRRVERAGLPRGRRRRRPASEIDSPSACPSMRPKPRRPRRMNGLVQLYPAIGVTDGDHRVPDVDQVLALHPAHLSRSR
jgi:hypothetical protein